MDSISMDGYRRASELADDEYRRTTRKRLIRLSLSGALLSVILIAVVAGAVVGHREGRSSPSPAPATPSIAESLKSTCNLTRYPNSCYSTISSDDVHDPESLLHATLQAAKTALDDVSTLPAALAAKTNDTYMKSALSDCTELFGDAIDRLTDSISQRATTRIDDVRTWLSAAVTDQETCADGLSGTALHPVVRAAMSNATVLVSNSLALATVFRGTLKQISAINRKLLGAAAPEWVSAASRRELLQAAPEANVTVAKDGSGEYETIGEALEAVPKKNKYPFVIHIKAGVYVENVVVEKGMWNVVFVGDGMYETVVSGSLNKVDGATTFRSATVAVVGRAFMARDIGFRNTAGPEKHQAVALRSGSDHSVFYRCSFDAYQDTLYTHSLRQFYRECDVIGTVDFIFGDAAAVLQDCRILPRQPLPGQKNTITASGRSDPNENTGIAIQGGTVSPLGNVTAETYLGRPWKDYSTAIFMETEIGGMVVGEGWLTWEPDVVPPATIYYAEYRNTGPGSKLGARVTWPGYRGMVSRSEAMRFSVDSFLNGGDWIPPSGVAFTFNLG